MKIFKEIKINWFSIEEHIENIYKDDFKFENHRPSTSQRREQERDHRRLRSAKRAQFVDQQLIEQTRFY